MIPTIFMLFFLLVALFCGLIFPVWTLVYCANSKRSNKFKTTWIMVMILLWPLGSSLYGLFSSKRRLFQSIGGSIILVSFLFFGLVFWAINWTSHTANVGISHVLSTFEAIDTSELSAEEELRLRESLDFLQEEMKTPWVEIDKKINAIGLFEIFQLFIEDDHLSAAEYLEWMDIFESRKALNRNLLNQFIHHLKQKEKQGINL